MRHRPIITAVLMALASVASARGGPATKRDDAAEPKLVPIGQALVALSQEARDSWDKKKAWPSSKSDFAQRKNWALSRDELMAALSRSVNPEPAIDGYVKWQLLSFAPPLDQADVAQAQKIIATMPRLMPQPEPHLPDPPPPQVGLRMSMDQTTLTQSAQGSGPPRLSVATSGTSLAVAGRTSPDNRYVTATAVNTSSSELGRQRHAAEAAAAPGLRYRDALIAALPERNGVRLAAMLHDAWDRIAAGDKSYETAVNRLVKECRKLTADSPIPPATRQSLARDAECFRELRTPVVESFHPAKNQKGDYIESKGYVAQFPPDKLQVVLSCLRDQAAAQTQPAADE